MRVIGIDAGTVSLDLCGLDDGAVFLDRSFPTRDALADPSMLVQLLEAAAPLDLVVAPSGYGLPLIAARDVTESDLKLAFLAAEGEPGGIGGLRALVRALIRSPLPVVLTPGVVHMASVPAHRKVNRVDMGTADKVCAAALAIREQANRLSCSEREVSFILLELGGAFTAAIAVEDGGIVDGIGGTSGPLGVMSGGAWDGEVAFLAGHVSKEMLFGGGVAVIADSPMAWRAYVESAAKAIAALAVSAPRARDVVLSGRYADFAAPLLSKQEGCSARSFYPLRGFAAAAKQGAQGAALIANGLAGGHSKPLVAALGIREASGTVLDHLHVITPAAARARLGIST
jgi:predicted butyrate kinase (DUF1464 family)